MSEVMLVKVDGVLQPRMVAEVRRIELTDGKTFDGPRIPEVRAGETLIEYFDLPPEIITISVP